MTRALSHADCVVHPIDVTGLGGDGGVTQDSVARDLTRQTPGRESLHFMASETGGRFFKDTNDLGTVLDEVADMTSRYYILGYQPQDLRGPGRFHKLKVKVRRKGSKVSHRTGFYERTPRSAQTVLQRKFEAAQLVMMGVGTNDLSFSALCLPFPMIGERQDLGLVLQVPREELRWEAGRALGLEVYAYAVAADGTVVDYLAQFVQLDPGRADPERQARGVSFTGTLGVPAGRYTIKLMVQEPETGASGVQFLDVTVPPYDARVGSLLPPVVMDEVSRWLGVKLGTGAQVRPTWPFQVAGQAYLPRASFQVTSGTPERLVLVAYEPDRPSDPAAGLEIQSSLTDAGGGQVPAGPLRIIRVHREPGGRRTYVLSYTPEVRLPGNYTFRIGIGEAGTRLESYTLLKVRAADAADGR